MRLHVFKKKTVVVRVEYYIYFGVSLSPLNQSDDRSGEIGLVRPVSTGF
jgi:hypothetical protein